MCGLSITPVSPDDLSVPITCETTDCFNAALQRVSMAGHPAGYLCTAHARLWAQTWGEVTGEVVRVQRIALQRVAA
jgi:hypothetical protein